MTRPTNLTLTPAMRELLLTILDHYDGARGEYLTEHEAETFALLHAGAADTTPTPERVAATLATTARDIAHIRDDAQRQARDLTADWNDRAHADSLRRCMAEACRDTVNARGWILTHAHFNL